jgi:hypothetical protein
MLKACVLAFCFSSQRRSQFSADEPNHERMLPFCCLAIYRLAGSLLAPNLYCTLLRVLDTESLVMVTFWFPEILRRILEHGMLC